MEYLCRNCRIRCHSMYENSSKVFSEDIIAQMADIPSF